MTTTVNVRCPFCGKISQIVCDEDSLAKYNGGALIQDAFPEMSPFEREALISGMCYDCQTSFFNEEDDEDDECEDECDSCPHYDCPLNTNEDN